MQSGIYLNRVSVQWGGYDQGMGPGMMNWGYGMGWFMGIVNIIFWVAVIVGVIYLIKWLSSSSKQGAWEAKTEDSAMEILRKRYASGEISKEEFEEKKRHLEK
ncbi:MAG: SHOCT domain-containing protein [Nitrospirota bacterium]